MLSNAAITVSRLSENKARRRTTGYEREEASWRQNKHIMKTFINYSPNIYGILQGQTNQVGPNVTYVARRGEMSTSDNFICENNTMKKQTTQTTGSSGEMPQWERSHVLEIVGFR